MPTRILAYARQNWLLLTLNGALSLTAGLVVAGVTR